MLLARTSTISPQSLVVIGVESWEIGGEFRCYGLIPIENVESPYVEVEVIATESMPAPIAPAGPSWMNLKMPGDAKSMGYPRPDTIAKDLYAVWDDGASRHSDAARRLYRYYQHLIDDYRGVALEYHLARYRSEQLAAKARGWDPSILPTAPSAYRYDPIHNNL